MNLPILSGGKQEPGSGKVCAEQAVNWLVSGRLELGDETDHPECVQPVLNALAIAVNDRMSDQGRAAMWPLILRQPGTARPELEPELSVQLAVFLAIEVAGARHAPHAAAATARSATDADAAADARFAAWSAVYASSHASAAAAADAISADADAYVLATACTAAAAHSATAAADADAAADAAYAARVTVYDAADAARSAAGADPVDTVLIDLLTKTQDYLEELIGTDQTCEVERNRIDALGALVGTSA